MASEQAIGKNPRASGTMPSPPAGLRLALLGETGRSVAAVRRKMEDSRHCFYLLLLITGTDCFLVRQPITSRHFSVKYSSYINVNRGNIGVAPLLRHSKINRPSLQMSCRHDNTAQRANIFLVGKSSIEKSVLGQSLAYRLNYSFIELDKLKVDTDSSEVAQPLPQMVRGLSDEAP